jgi:hypothetical protein
MDTTAQVTAAVGKPGKISCYHAYHSSMHSVFITRSFLHLSITRLFNAYFVILNCLMLSANIFANVFSYGGNSQY